MKTLDIQAKEWFDKLNGNSYFAALVTVDYNMPTEKSIKVPFQYGYGEQYETETTHQLQLDGVLPNDITIYSLSRYCRENGIDLRSSKRTNCLKRDLKNL